MPRTRRRHHSRSRSRSRSHSHDRDREPKRRKIESFDSPHHRRSVSSEPEAIENSKTEQIIQDTTKINSPAAEQNITMEIEENEAKMDEEDKEVTGNSSTERSNLEEKDNSNSDNKNYSSSGNKTNLIVENKSSDEDKNMEEKLNSQSDDSDSEDGNKSHKDTKSDHSDTQDSSQISFDLDSSNVSEQNISKTDSIEDKNVSIASLKSSELSIQPQKTLSPKQAKRKMEWERKREEKEKEKLKQREEREKKRLEEREEREKKKQQERDEKQKAKEMRDKMKQEKDDLKLKEKELKDKEKEMKRKDREEKEKQKEQEKIKKQLEMEEKNNKKQKASAAFVNFFVPKKFDSVEEKKKEETCNFMPFEVKSDMRLAPIIRKVLTEAEKDALLEILNKQEVCKLYLNDLKSGKQIGKSGKTWSFDEGSDDVIIMDDLGESIVEPKMEKMKAKFLKFHENQRPAYFGTWRKKSKFINPKNPLAVDKELLNYDVDSEEEWEDEVDGESIVGSDEDEKDNDSENDYEVDNDVFVPHGHLSDDEGVDDEDERFSPESHKAKLKLLKNQFEEEMKSKTQKIKPRLIGCVWYDKDRNVDDAIDKYLQPLSIIYNNKIVIKKRSDPVFVSKKEKKKLDEDLIPDFLRLVHGNTNKKAVIVKEYIEFLKESSIITVTPAKLNYQLRKVAEWTKCPEEGPMFNIPCWYVKEEIKNKFHIDLKLPNKWELLKKKV